MAQDTVRGVCVQYTLRYRREDELPIRHGGFSSRSGEQGSRWDRSFFLLNLMIQVLFNVLEP